MRLLRCTIKTDAILWLPVPGIIPVRVNGEWGLCVHNEQQSAASDCNILHGGVCSDTVGHGAREKLSPEISRILRDVPSALNEKSRCDETFPSSFRRLHQAVRKGKLPTWAPHSGRFVNHITASFAFIAYRAGCLVSDTLSTHFGKLAECTAASNFIQVSEYGFKKNWG
jgi:hypothetical protein